MLIFGGIKRVLTSVELHTICCRLVKTVPVHIAPYFKSLHFSPCNTAKAAPFSVSKWLKSSCSEITVECCSMITFTEY